MNSVKIYRLTLIGIVRENKAKHIAEHAEALKDYLAAVLKLSEENLRYAQTGDIEQFAKIKTMPPRPMSYEDNYRRAERMLELSIDDVIEVEEDIFNQLVLDEWSWKHSFSTSNTLYKTLAGSSI